MGVVTSQDGKRETSDTWELAFHLRGRGVPQDHGYVLYSALSAELPVLHDASWCSVLPIRGRVEEGDRVGLHPGSRLRVRIPSDRIPLFLPLVGRTLRLADTSVVVGHFEASPVTPAPDLDAKLVVIRLTQAPRAESGIDKSAFQAQFLAEASRQLEALGISSTPKIMGRGELRIKEQRIIGFSVRVSELSPESSLALLHAGIGGKRKLGCGVFEATRGTPP